MGCPVSTPTKSPVNKEQTNVESKQSDENRLNLVTSSSPPPRKDSFIHEMLRPQLDPSVPSIGVGKFQKQVKDEFELLETASVENCLVQVISMRNEVTQQSQQNQEQNQPNMRSNVDHPHQASISSVATMDISSSSGQQNITQHICGTTVTFEWLFQRLVEKFKCLGEPEPQWIVEKLNDIGERDLDRTTVMRITFGWENQRLPKSIVLKIFERHEDDDPEEAKLGSTLFKRECQTYEWLSRQKRIAIPKIFVIKKKWSKSCSALLVMEDLSERAQTGELVEDIPMEGIRDLLRNLAHLHSSSMVKPEEWRQSLGGAQLPAFLFEQIERFARRVSTHAGYLRDFNIERFRQLEPVMSSANIEKLVTQSCAELDLPESLIHGLPIARNVFFRLAQMEVEGEKQQISNDLIKDGTNKTSVLALIDWTQAHSGCFGEDLAKCICWNLDVRQRDEGQLHKLLQYYHYQLLKKLQFYEANADLQKRITLDRVKAAYERFMPLAAVTFLLFLPEDLNNADLVLLERTKQLVKEAAQMIMTTNKDRQKLGEFKKQ